MSKPTAEVDVICKLINTNYVQQAFVLLFQRLHICYYKFTDLTIEKKKKDPFPNIRRPREEVLTLKERWRRVLPTTVAVYFDKHQTRVWESFTNPIILRIYLSIPPGVGVLGTGTSNT